LVPLRHCAVSYTGGLDTTADADGTHGLFFRAPGLDLVYHVPTLMPNLLKDPDFTYKARHVGNDFVSIVFNESGDEALPSHSLIAGAFNFVTITVTPLGTAARIAVRRNRPSLPEFGPVTKTHVVSTAALGPIVRATAISANEAAVVLAGGEGKPSTPWEKRLALLQKLRAREEAARRSTSHPPSPSPSLSLPSAAPSSTSSPSFDSPRTGAARDALSGMMSLLRKQRGGGVR
jgi:tuberous sclerosis protein 2